MVRREKHERLSEELKDAVCRDYQNGEKIIVMQMEHGIYSSSIYSILRERHIPLRRK